MTSPSEPTVQADQARKAEPASPPPVPSDGSAAGAIASNDAIASPGQVVAECRLEHLLGRGGMGEVYLAEHLGLRKKVAVKLLRLGLFSSPDVVERFQQEAALAASIEHPNVIRVLHAGQQEHLFFMVLEYVDGETLANRIERKGALRAEEALDVAEQAARGLAAAHAKGIIHRDIKPENLLLTREGQVKVADFGIARAAFVAGGLTTAGQVLGTPYYMSPEQVEARTIDARTDLYSLGATLYFALTRRPPVEGETVHALFSAVLLSQPVRLSKRLPGIPPAVEALVMRLLEKDPMHRFSSAEEVMEAIAKARRGESCVPARSSTRAKPVPVVQAPVVQAPVARTSVPGARRRYTATLAIALLLLVALVVPGVRHAIVGMVFHPVLIAGTDHPMPVVADGQWSTVAAWGRGQWPDFPPQGWTVQMGSTLLGTKDADPIQFEVPSLACVVDLDFGLPQGSGGVEIDLLSGPTDASPGYRVTWQDGRLLEWKHLGGGVLGTHVPPAIAPAGSTHHLQLVLERDANCGIDIDGKVRLSGRTDDPVLFTGIRLLLRPSGGTLRIAHVRVQAPREPLPPSGLPPIPGLPQGQPAQIQPAPWQPPDRPGQPGPQPPMQGGGRDPMGGGHRGR